MIAGASTSCLFPMLTEQSLEHLMQMGIRTVEVFLNSPSERTLDFAARLGAIAKPFGANIVSVHPYSSESEGVSFFGRYPRRFDDEVEGYKRYFEICAALGADMFVFHGARNFLPMEAQFYFERFACLRDIARQFGVRLCQENIARCHSGSVSFIKEMKQELPDVDFVLDIKQALRAKTAALEMLEAMGKNLAHVHISDHNADCDCLALGDGVLDTKQFIEQLKGSGFNKAVILELYSWNFNDEKKLKQGVELLESYMQP